MEKENSEQEIDLIQYYKIIMRRKSFILKGVVICTVLAMITTFFLPSKYSSEGILSFSEKKLDLSIYKSYANMFTNINRLNNFLGQSDEKIDMQINSDFFEKSIKVDHCYEDLPQNNNTVVNNCVIGIRLVCYGGNAENAQKKVALLGSYISTVIVNAQIWDFYSAETPDINKEISKSKNDIMKLEYDNTELKGMADLISSKLINTSQSERIYDRLVLQVTELSEKYLPPQQQIISTNIQIRKNEDGIRRLNKKILVNITLLKYMDKAMEIFSSDPQFLTDKFLLEKLENLKIDFFSDLKNNEETEAFYEIDEMHKGLIKTDKTFIRFVSGPTLVPIPINNKSTFIIILVFFGSLFFFMIYSLFAEWSGNYNGRKMKHADANV